SWQIPRSLEGMDEERVIVGRVELPGWRTSRGGDSLSHVRAEEGREDQSSPLRKGNPPPPGVRRPNDEQGRVHPVLVGRVARLQRRVRLCPLVRGDLEGDGGRARSSDRHG